MGSVRSYAETLDSRLSQINTAAPRVSLIVTSHNYSEYIRDCLQSVTCQSYPHVECIVVDDHSSDDSPEKIRRFIENDRSGVVFKWVQHESTRGQYAAFRTGLAHASAPFVSFLDADDLLLPDFVSEHVRVHLTFPPVAFTSANQYQIDAKGELTGGTHPDLHTLNTYRNVGTISLHRSFWVWATTSSMMFRRAVLHYVLSDADAAFQKCADNYVCHFADLLGGSLLIPRVLGCYRRHQRNAFSNNPLIGGRLPTGDMRHHPAHDTVLHHIRCALFQRRQEFIALLGIDGYLHVLAKVTRLAELWPCGLRIARSGNVRQSIKFYAMFGRLTLRTWARTARGRRAGYVMHDLEGIKRGAIIASYADYQRHRRDAK